MKKYFIAILLSAMIGGVGLAQNRVGGVRIYPILLEERNDSLYLEMDVFVDGKSMNSCQSWTILPCLIVADTSYSMNMPLALINGETKAKLFKRREKFGNEYLFTNYPEYKIDKKKRKDLTFRYKTAIPYEPWMDTASLTINQILHSCANTEQWFVWENVAEVRLSSYIPYIPTVTVNYIVPPKEIKFRQMEGKAYLYFQTGQSEILRDFRRNPQELAKIDEELSRVRDNEDFEIHTLHLIGYASPEGIYKSNDRLSYNRAEALRHYIQNKFDLSGQLIQVSNVPEDWQGLVRMIQKSEMEGKYQVLDIIETVSEPDTRENRLRNLKGGRYFRYMLNEMFPSLRRVEYRGEFTVKEYSLDEAEVIMQKSPEQLNQYELSLLCRHYPDDSHQQEYLANLILHRYPDDPIANNNHVARLLERGDVSGAARFIEKIAGLPEAYNNVGVYYLLLDEPDRAEDYFKKALLCLTLTQAEVPYHREEIEHHLQEVDKKRKDLQNRMRYNK